MMLTFVIPGPCIPKGRPRVGPARTVTPKRTKRYEKTVAAYALQARCRRIGWPLGARYAVTVNVYRARADGDLDNFCKTVLDACNTVLWNDDRQVVELHAYRCDMAGAERTEVSAVVLEYP